MFAAPILALGISALALATPARRAPALEISLSAPKSVSSIDNITVTAAVTNTGSEAVKVIKYGTVLDSGLPTASFQVSKAGKPAKFTGVKLMVDPDALDDSAFVVIGAGETVTVEHEVASLYDFETLGLGTFTFTPKTSFQVVDDQDASLNKFKIAAAEITVDVQSDVARREIPGPTTTTKEKRSTVSCSNASQSSFIAASYTEGKALASIAASYISSNSGGSLYRSYFGTTSTSTVRTKFTNVANENTSSRTLSCSDPYSVCSGGVIAYTLLSGVNPIYYCSIFYNEVTTSRLCSGTSVASRNIRGGTTLHELTHATSGTDDIGYGCSYDQSLASSNPSQAAINADNYNCFATQVYASTRC